MSSGNTISLRAFFGHHKCATGWINKILSEMCFHLGRRFLRVNQEKEFDHRESLAAYLQNSKTELVAYNNAKAEHVQQLPLHSGVHVVRDPRDILVSAYFSHLHSHQTKHWPELIPHRERLQELSEEEGLFCEMDFSHQQFEDMLKWNYAQENVLELKMEELTQAPVQGFREIMEFLGWLAAPKGDVERWKERALLLINRVTYKAHHTLSPALIPPYLHSLSGLSPGGVERFVKRYSFSKLSGGREKGEENKKSHYRKGKAGDWKNHFTDEHRRVFKERYNDVLVELGYETDANW
jgi:hypothetical protein